MIERGSNVPGAVAVVLAATIPFLTKPLHIDDPADLQYVEQVLRKPADPYGFELDWDEGPRPAFENYHPPLKYYYQALVLAVVPLSEVALHASYVPIVAITAWAVCFLGRRFGCPPLLVLLLWMLGPGYLPGQNAMLDVPVMALSLSATALLVSGVDRDRMGRVCLAGMIGGAAILTKYSALMYLPVWMGYLIGRGRLRHWTALAIPIAALVFWCVLSKALYGEPHAAILFHRVPGQQQSLDGRVLCGRLLSAAVFLGGAMPGAVLMFAGRDGLRRIILAGAVVSAVLAGWLVPPARAVVGEPTELTLVNLAWWCFLAATGLAVILYMACQLIVTTWPWRRSSSGQDDAFLAWWFCVTLALGALASPFLAMRHVVEASLPAWILLLRCRTLVRGFAKAAFAMGTVFNTALGFAVAAADYQFAAVYPRFAHQLAEGAKTSPIQFWCHGYWGWYYYPRANGLSRYVLDRQGPPAGSFLVIPDEAAKPAVLPAELRLRLKPPRNQSVPGRGYLPIRLMHYQAGAGYYSTSWGPLPYAWSLMPTEVFHFYEVAAAL